MTLSPTHRAALWCAQQGWYVHPYAANTRIPTASCRQCAREVTRGGTRVPNPDYVPHEHTAEGCPCISAGQYCHGVRAATNDVDLINRWWGSNPRFGVGVACGLSGIAFLDVDAHEGAQRPENGQYLPGLPAQPDELMSDGWDAIAALAWERNAEVPWYAPETFAVHTPSGGLHAWYRLDDPWAWKSGSSQLAWQVDWKAGWASAPVPNTVTRKGSYTAIGTCRTVADLPLWLAADLKRTGHRAPVQRRGDLLQRLSLMLDRPKGDGYVAAALRGEVERVTDAPQGERNASLNRAAYSLGRFVSSGQLSEEDVEDALTEAAYAAGMDGSEISGTIRSGLRAGMKNGATA